MLTRFLIVLTTAFLFILSTSIYAQVEVQGSGNSNSTVTFSTSDSDGDTTLVIRDSGKVGIGTTSPSQKLEVNGMIYSSAGGFKFPDGSVLSSAPINIPYASVYTVATSGGDFTSIQTAIIACAGASRTNPYLVRVMPGVYNEPIINCQKFVDLTGSGKYSCFINGTVNGADSCLIENFSILQGISCNMTSPVILNNMITRTDLSYAVGIDITAPGHPWIDGNEIIDCKGYGIVCNGYGADAWITGNKILRNEGGGIRCMDSSPLISNNLINFNQNYGIYLVGGIMPSSPTIDNNTIANTDQFNFGIGISISSQAEPRIIANDICRNGTGIEIDPPAQPSIISNNINYNEECGIRCYSTGFNKKVVIMGNHIHSNTGTSGINSAGIFIGNCDPVITQNNVSQNRRPGSTFPDIDYSGCSNSYPMISLNVFDYILKSTITAQGLYNVTSAGASINP